MLDVAGSSELKMIIVANFCTIIAEASRAEFSGPAGVSGADWLIAFKYTERGSEARSNPRPKHRPAPPTHGQASLLARILQLSSFDDL